MDTTDLILPLLNVFPFKSREHTPFEKALAKGTGEPLQDRMTYQNEIDFVKAVIDEEGGGQSRSAMSDALQSSCVYKSWQTSMPHLKDVKGIHFYRNNNTYRYNINDVNCEIITFGGFLEKDQILFSGGSFCEENLIVNDRLISATMMPSVAWWHAVEVQGQIAILRISASNSVKAFAFKTKGHQRHKEEFEVLLQSNLTLRYQNSFTHNGMNVLKYDVCKV
jgi:hypothetical protein